LSMIPACTCKLAACVDPFVYAINHPKWAGMLLLLFTAN
jgi:r-opsin